MHSLYKFEINLADLFDLENSLASGIAGNNLCTPTPSYCLKNSTPMRTIDLIPSDQPRSELLPVLKMVDQWICWAEHRSEAKDEKIPLNTDSYISYRKEFSPAGFSDKSIWMPYEEAIEKCERHNDISGIGFVFTDSDNISYIDIDDCIEQKSLKMNEEPFRVMKNIDSYAEFSPSQTGIHIISRGKASSHGWAAGKHNLNISIWDRSWMTVTQNHIKGTPAEIRGDNYLLNSLCEEYGIDMHEPWVK